MKMSGEQRIAASRQKVWEALNDPEVLKQSIPGCQSLEKESDDRFQATVAIKVGPIGARFLGAVTLSDLDAPNGYTITGEGQGGAAGFAKGGAKIRLADDAGGTLLTYDVDAQVGGKMAQLGGAIIDATAKNLAGQFFTRFGDIVAPQAPKAGAAKPAAKSAVPVASTSSAAGSSAAVSAPTPGGTPAQANSMSWLLAVIVAALFGFLLGRNSGGGWGGGYLGASTGLLIVIVAAAAFEFGRRAAAPVIMLDSDLLKRITALVSEKKL